MSKIRIYELAKQLNVANKDLMEKIHSVGIEAKSHMGMLTEEEAAKVTALYQPKKEEPKKEEPKKEAPKKDVPKQQAPKQDGQKKDQKQGGNKPAQKQDNRNDNRQGKPQQQNGPKQGGNQQQGKPQNKENNKGKDKKGNKNGQKVKENPMERRRREMEEEAALMAELAALEAAEAAANADPVIKYIPESITVKDLAEVLGKKGSDLVMNLMKKGKMLAINATLDFDTAASIAEEYNVILELEEEKDIMEEAFGTEEEEDESKLEERPPVVVVMGHVDHGKTSLLDAIRHANVTKGEAGGITQHIGAYTVQIDGKPITFLDTPGHEAFTAMRMRGAQVTDIAILVVAADDGVMPQTIEAINHAKAAGVEIIVAINKMDKPSANPDRVKQELTEYGLRAEDWGGTTVCVPVSARSKEGIDNLLEMIILTAEMKELKANPNKKARGAIIEAQLDKGRGPVATVLVQRGTLHIGDTIIAGTAYGKVRAMVNDRGEKVKKALPSTPVEVLGLNDVPAAGDILDSTDEKTARSVAEKRIAKKKEDEIKLNSKVSLDDLFQRIQEGEIKELNIVVKADVQGTIEALKASLEKIKNDEVKVVVVHAGVGAITESDVMLASAANALIIGFNVRPDANARKASETEKVDVRTYRVIYDALNDVEAAIKGMLAPKFKEVVQGRVEVRQLITISKLIIAGCYVLEGKVTNSSKVRVVRDGIVINEDVIESLRRFKDDVKEVAQGYECGITLEKFRDLKVGDVFEVYDMEEVAVE